MSERIKVFQRLLKKVAGEIRDPGQLLDRSRRDKLIDEGLKYLLDIFSKRNAEISLEELSKSFAIKHLDVQNIDILASPHLPAAIAIFPEGTSFSFVGNTYLEAVKFAEKPVVVAGPSIAMAEKSFRPRFGYYDGEKDVAPLVERAPKDEVQHGGIAISPSGELHILNYQQLVERWTKRADSPDTLIQSDWYMDSNNFQAVIARENLKQEPQPFNALCQTQTDSGVRYFSITNYAAARDALVTGMDIKGRSFSRFIRIDEVALLAQAMSLAVGGTDWQLAGLEFISGGTFTYPIPGQVSPISCLVAKTH